MSPALSWEKCNAIFTHTAELARLLNVVEEQDFLQEHMSSASLKECIECGENNLARVQLVVRAILTDDNVGLYNALCTYSLARSEAYTNMYKTLSCIEPAITLSLDTSKKLDELQVKVEHLTEELKCWRAKEQEINKQLDVVQTVQKESCELKKTVQELKKRTDEIGELGKSIKDSKEAESEIKKRLAEMQKASVDLKKDVQDVKEIHAKDNIGGLRKKMEDWIKSETDTFKSMQTSIEAVTKAVNRPPPPFPNPHSADIRTKVEKANLNFWQGFSYKLVPFLCDEDGVYFVDWDNKDEQWKLGDFGKNRWFSSFYVRFSMVLPRQFNANDLNDRVVNVLLNKNGASLSIQMSHISSLSANVKSTIFKCKFHLSIKHNGNETSFTEIRETIQCEVNNSNWQIVYKTGDLPFTSFSTKVAPRLRLTLAPL